MRYTDAVSVEYQLLVGVFKLEGDAWAVTKDQAATMLPLWKQILTLSGGNLGPGMGGQGQLQTQANATPAAAPTLQPTSAKTQAQIDALVDQIQAAMTADQIQAIADMKITQATAKTIMQSKMSNIIGGQQNGAAPMGNGTPPAGMGQAPEGTPGAGGGGAGGMGAPSGAGKLWVTQGWELKIRMGRFHPCGSIC